MLVWKLRLTEEGIIPGTDKLKAVKNAPPPSNVHEVRQFLGLCNFFEGMYEIFPISLRHSQL